MLKPSGNPYQKKKMDTCEKINMVTVSCDFAGFNTHHTSSDEPISSIIDNFNPHSTQNNRKRVFSSTEKGTEPPAYPQLTNHSLWNNSHQVVATGDNYTPYPLNKDVCDQSEMTLMKTNPYAKKSDHSMVKITQVLNHSSTIPIEEKGFNISPPKHNNAIDEKQIDVHGQVNVPTIATNDDSRISSVDEYDCNIDWNSIALNIDVDQTALKSINSEKKYTDTIERPSSSYEELHSNQDAKVSISSHHPYSMVHEPSTASTLISNHPSTYDGIRMNGATDRPSSSHDGTAKQKQIHSVGLIADSSTRLKKSITACTFMGNDTKQEITPKSTNYNDSSGALVGSDLKLLSYDKARVNPIDDDYKHQLIKNADLNGTLANGWKLLPHQKAGVLRALMMRRLILAYDMGLGKTLVGCVWAKAFTLTFPSIRVFIICPVSLAQEWERTAWESTRLDCELEDKKIGGKHSKAKPTEDVPMCKIFSWAKVPSIPKNIEKYIVVCDEAHHMQNMETSRTKDTLSLVMSDKCIGVLLLSGTPMKNGRPSNLFPLLKAVRHPFGDDQHSFEVTFCDGHFKNFKANKVWDASGSSNLPTLNSHIASHLLCKTKEDCLRDLPSKTREYKTVQVSSRFELQFAHAMNELAKVQDLVDNADDEVKSEAVLGAFQIVRLIASRAKVDATVSIARSILETESSIVIFTYFVEVAKEVRKKLFDSGWNGEVLAGDVPAAKRQAMVDNFQSGITPVFVATFGAGGVGITLTAACTIILLDRPWTPGDAFQAEDRVRRIGQTRPVRSIWMRGFDIDIHIDNMIQQKNFNSATVVDGRSSSYSIQENQPKVSLRQLIQSLISKNRSTVQELQKIYNPNYSDNV